MTSVPPSSNGESAGLKMEQVEKNGGELPSSSPPQSEITEKSSTPQSKIREDVTGVGDKPSSASVKKTARQAAAAAAAKRAENASKTPRVKSATCRQTASSIPLPIPKTARSSIPTPRASPSHNVVARTGATKIAKPTTCVSKSATQGLNKHTLEMQFNTKKKKLAQMHKDLLDKQKPVLELYQNLIQIKKKLEELGKVVTLDDLKLMPYPGEGPAVQQKPHSPVQTVESPKGAGETIPPEIVTNMQSSIEEIPNTLMEICKNLLARRNVIVELLENIIKSEVNVDDLSEQIETLKSEGAQLQSNLDVVINEHHIKIKEIVKNWQILLKDKAIVNNSNVKVEDLEEHIKAQEKLYEESKQVIHDLQKKLDDKRNGHDRYVSELNNVISGLKEQIQKLEQDLEAEKKSTQEFKSRNNTNAQASKSLRTKINELENDKRAADTQNAELSKKLRLLQDQMKHKETQWNKEKDEITKNLKHQENMMQKLAAEKTNFETRISSIQDESMSLEDMLKSEIFDLKEELRDVKSQLQEVTFERDEAQTKCKELTDHITQLVQVDRDTINGTSDSGNWSKNTSTSTPCGDVYSESMMKDIMIKECKEQIKRLNDEIALQRQTMAMMMEKTKKIQENIDSEANKKVIGQNDLVLKYEKLLSESENKVAEKSEEVETLTSEITQLRMRQEQLEEINQQCTKDNVHGILEVGQLHLTDLMNKSLESEQKILHCENIIDKQFKQMNEMENLLKYRENMANVLKAARDELIIEKESLTRYSQEMRMVLGELTKENRMKERLAQELEEKVKVRDAEITKLTKAVELLETKLTEANNKRFKLQESLQAMERDMQSTRAHVAQLADINTRYALGTKSSGSISLKTLKTIENFGDKNEDMAKRLLDSIHQDDELNCTSLIGMSLQQVDYLKNRLHYLTQLNAATLSDLHHYPKPRKPSLKKMRVKESLLKTEFSHCKLPKAFSKNTVAEYCGRHKHLAKVMELTAKRYEYLQQQAYESYEELTNLIKLAASDQKLPII